VNLSDEEREEIQNISNGNSACESVKKRASILLLRDSSAGKPMIQKEVAKRCGVCEVTVLNTVREYCTYGKEYTLSFKRTTVNNPPIVTGDVEARIVALACGEAPDGRARWTIRLLTERVIELNILDTVSRETIRTTLKKTNLSPT
jgi:hypothetical protein